MWTSFPVEIKKSTRRPKRISSLWKSKSPDLHFLLHSNIHHLVKHQPQNSTNSLWVSSHYQTWRHVARTWVYLSKGNSFFKCNLFEKCIYYQIRPLSTPFKPILWPQSAIRMFGHMFPSESLIWAINACTPWLLPFI